MTDPQLISLLGNSAIEEREHLVLQLEIIQELDRRHLFFHYSSLWAFLVEEIGFEESASERKIRAARAMKKFPELKELILSGQVNLSLLEIALGCSHQQKLSHVETSELIRSIAGMSCRKAKREIAERYPESAEVPRDRMRPIHDGYTEITFYADADLMSLLEEVQGLLAHSKPGMPMREVVSILAENYYDRHHPVPRAQRALERQEKKEELEKEALLKRAAPLEQTAPSAPKVEASNTRTQVEVQTRAHSQGITHALVRRDGYICSYQDRDTGQSCQSSHDLEKHHVQSWSSGGATSLDNAIWLCRHHHQRITFLEFGELAGLGDYND